MSLDNSLVFGSILVDLLEVLRQLSASQVLSELSFFQELNSLSVSSLVSLEDSDNPLFTGEGFGEVVELVVLVPGIDVSHCVPTFGLAH